MTMINVDQQRAIHAWDAIKGASETLDEGQFAEFCKALEGLGVSIRNLGLARGLALLYHDAEKTGVETLLIEIAGFVANVRRGGTSSITDRAKAKNALIIAAGNGEGNHDGYFEVLEETLAYIEHLRLVAPKVTAEAQGTPSEASADAHDEGDEEKQ
ncbi:MAG: hypothetical protein JNL58_29210 [Planctomyces sp.]|nr:hypothetical protein [Planctomyces sp.]